MYWETLPNWFWVLYYLFLLSTLGTAIYSIVKKKGKILPFLTIMFTVTIPIVAFINSLGRAEEMNEFEHLVSQLQKGASWAIYSIIGYLFLFIWWFSFCSKVKIKTKLSDYFRIK